MNNPSLGGPGAAHEAEQFIWNDHVVIPVSRTGGAASGKFNVPDKIFQVGESNLLYTQETFPQNYLEF